MATTQKFKVMRPHLGDKPYNTGDTRVANPMRVKHLVKKGVLKPMAKRKAKGPAKPAQTKPEPQNKTKVAAPTQTKA